ncbi:MAG TPA: GIY-YIG nuclease family protein [Alphaproteobacteria bacterium]|nr:GIY-YIG nuclease family protein [Alphaproteobacteria bacterium]
MTESDVRNQILNEIRKLADASNGRPPGMGQFEQATGIRKSAWRGVYWARWGDALIEAGFQPNNPPERFTEDFLCAKLAVVCRHFKRAPSSMELRLYSRAHSDFPDPSTFRSHFHNTPSMFRHLTKWVGANPAYGDVAEMLSAASFRSEKEGAASREGLVYLLRSGSHYKIGRSDELERRVKEIRTSLPEETSMIHAIRTDDPPGIEAYWHRRFADKRANGEWFKLSAADVAAFKRRKTQ